MRDNKRSKKRKSSVLLFWIVGLSLSGLAVFVMSQNFTTVVTGYRIQKLEDRKRLLGQKNRRLQLEVLSLSELARIEKIARNDLGMIAPSPDSIKYVKLRVSTKKDNRIRPGFLVSLRRHIEKAAQQRKSTP